ncbi:MAG: ABC transporter permease [Alphaproteobacteria bacterium]|nr:ABC transporter permease [Alphaproteobacteria bacterium]MCB9695373.1 ABC transporter permease [Alphaproteobacteria bacterium]
MALAQLRRNWSRTLLTSLGIAVGVGALVAIVGIGQGASRSIEQDLASMGSNLVSVEAGTGGGPQAHVSAPPFQDRDIESIRRQVPHLSGVAPMASSSVTTHYAGLTWSTSVTGSSPDWLGVAGWTLASGRALEDGEARSGAAVCVLGETVRENLFGDLDPLGARIRLGDADCTVIGVLAAKGENTMGMDQDDLVWAPVRFVQRRLLGTTGVDRILLSVDDAANTDEVLLSLDAVIRELRHVRSDATVDFQIRDTREMAEHVGGITTVLTGLLGAVAAVSLFVGGIGIMNVMLVSVGERTHEIGIRMAVGALQGDVMAQFLVESATLSALGGLAGVALGVAVTAVGATVLEVPFVVVPAAVIGAVVVSAGLGVMFGWMPARRAARLEPIDALRAP